MTVFSELPKRIIQEDNVRLAVGSPGQTQPLLLAAAQVEAALSYLRLVSGGEDLQVGGQGAGRDHLLVFLLVLGKVLTRPY